MYLDPSIIHKSIWEEDNPTRITWITLLAIQDDNGTVLSTVEKLADDAKLSIQEVEAAISKFCSPDPKSSTPDNDGRRLAEIPGGWKLLNRPKYKQAEKREQQELRDCEKRQMASERVAKHRAKSAQAESSSTEEKRPPFAFDPPNEARRLQMCALYRRKPESQWTAREQAAFKRFVPQATEEDLAILVKYYLDPNIRPEDDYRRRDLQTLLNNFPCEIDRAKAWYERPRTNCVPVWKQISLIEEQISKSEANHRSTNYNPKCSSSEKELLSRLKTKLTELKLRQQNESNNG